MSRFFDFQERFTRPFTIAVSVTGMLVKRSISGFHLGAKGLTARSRGAIEVSAVSSRAAASMISFCCERDVMLCILVSSLCVCDALVLR